MKLFGMVTTTASSVYTPHALASFFRTTKLEPGDVFILVDNDGTFDSGLLSAYPEVLFRKNPRQRGYAENGNALIDEALQRGADLYFLNNDVILTGGWLEPLLQWPESIVSPLSNREVQYASTVMVPKTNHISHLFACQIAMGLEDYLGNEAALEAIAEANRRAAADFFRVYCAAFFAIRIPFGILQTLGHFDTSFGRAGGEDFDYCLRAYLAGLDVRYAIRSFILHFGGKSSWSGAETPEVQQSREAHFRSVFREKWGAELHDMILREDKEVLGKQPGLLEKNNSGDLRGVIEQLMGGRKVALHLP